MKCPVAERARLAPDDLAVAFGAASWTWAAVDQHVRRWTSWLAARGVGPEGRVAIVSENEPHVLAAVFAAARLGATAALLHARLTAGEREPLLARLGARVVLGIGGEPLGPRDAPAAAHDDLPGERAAALLFTSGTTGTPRAAELPWSALLSSAEAVCAALGIDRSARLLGALPLYHVGGLGLAVRAAVSGAALHLTARFDAADVARRLRDDGITHASFVAASLQRTLDAAEPSGRLASPALRVALLGGGPTPEPLLRRALAAGVPVLHTYGLTEAASMVTCERPGEADGTSTGVPLPGVHVRVVDEGGVPVPHGTVGAIEVASPALFRRYLDDPAATAMALRGGWLRTGDVGRLDARGRLSVLARRTDLFVTGGENVYPAEVEAALMAHPAVREAAVFGEPHPTWGQAGCAAVVLRSPSTPGLDGELRAFLRGRLAPFKVPRRLLPVPELPRTPSGKIDRTALQELVRVTT